MAIVIGIIEALIVSAAFGFLIAGWWRVFEKAGKPGWAALVPIYNLWLLVEIVKKPVLWFIMLLIPCVGAVFYILLCIELAKAFGKTAGYGVGLALLGPIFFPMLGLGDAVYTPPADLPQRPAARDDAEEEDEQPRRRVRR
jgi:hypothetical protein